MFHDGDAHDDHHDELNVIRVLLLRDSYLISLFILLFRNYNYYGLAIATFLVVSTTGFLAVESATTAAFGALSGNAEK